MVVKDVGVTVALLVCCFIRYRTAISGVLVFICCFNQPNSGVKTVQLYQLAGTLCSGSYVVVLNPKCEHLISP